VGIEMHSLFNQSDYGATTLKPKKRIMIEIPVDAEIEYVKSVSCTTSSESKQTLLDFHGEGEEKCDQCKGKATIFHDSMCYCKDCFNKLIKNKAFREYFYGDSYHGYYDYE
jgi:hypothetical protein